MKILLKFQIKIRVFVLQLSLCSLANAFEGGVCYLSFLPRINLPSQSFHIDNQSHLIISIYWSYNQYTANVSYKPFHCYTCSYWLFNIITKMFIYKKMLLNTHFIIKFVKIFSILTRLRLCLILKLCSC